MRGARWPRVLTLIALICVTSRSHAATQALDLEYDADTACPSQDDFSALVLEKLAASGVEGSGARPQIAAHLHAASSGFLGDLELRRSDASNYEREVSGASCAEVANALAFVLALALGAKDTAAASSESVAPGAVAPPAAPSAVPSVEPPPVAPNAPAQPPKPAVEKRHSLWRLGAGAQLGERTGLGASTSSVVGSAFLEARRISVRPFGVTFRAGLSSVQTAHHGDSNGTADVSWWAAKLEVCPLRLRILEPLSLLPCAAADVGRQIVTGNPKPEPGSSSRTASKVWLDGLAAARLELSLARWLSVELQGELIVPFSRYRFAFNPDTLVYRAPGVASGIFAGLAAHFP